MFYFFYDRIRNPHQLFHYALHFVIGYHFVFLFSIIALYKWGEGIPRKIENFKIRPLHVFFRMLLVFGLAFTDYQLVYSIRAEVPNE